MVVNCNRAWPLQLYIVMVIEKVGHVTDNVFCGSC